jgi:TPR repeat protein
LHGDRDAQYNLAEFYLNGIGSDIDKKKAEQWFAAAAEQNQKEAVVCLEQLKRNQ